MSRGLLLSGILRLPPPPGWIELPPHVMSDPRTGRPVEARRFLRSRDELRVIAGREQHGGRAGTVLHVSASFEDRLPTWEDLRAVKEAFLGDVYAYQVLPPAREYVNRHPFTLHLWATEDGSDPITGAKP